VVQSGHGRCVVRSFKLARICSLERAHEYTGDWAEQNGGGEGIQISRLPGGFLEARALRFLRSFIYSMATAKEMATYNDIVCARG